MISVLSFQAGYVGMNGGARLVRRLLAAVQRRCGG